MCNEKRSAEAGGVKEENIQECVPNESPASILNGLFETHLRVSCLESAMRFYGPVLGLELGFYDKARRAAFYWIGPNRNAMLGVWERFPWDRDSNPGGITPQHLAFEVKLDSLRPALDRIKQRGIEVRDFFDRVTDEPTVFGWIPAASLYFKDQDGHLFEIIARLDGEPAPDVGVVSLGAWSALRRTDSVR